METKDVILEWAEKYNVPCHPIAIARLIDGIHASRQRGTVTESIFSSKHYTIPMADVQHIEKFYHACDLTDGTKKGDFQGIKVITKHTTWDVDCDCWANNIWLSGDEAKSFIKAWCDYRHELEIDTLKKPME